MIKRLGTYLEKLAAERPVYLSFLVLVGAALIVIPLSLPYYIYDTDGFWENILAEAHGTLLDLLVIGWFLLWLNKRAEGRITNNRYREEIEDYLGWRSAEATHRIAGNIRRLNRGGVKKKLRLTHAYLKGANLTGASLEEADLWGADLEGASLGAANMAGASLGGANLEGAELETARLDGADLRGAMLTGIDLERSSLVRADLRGSILTGADLQYADLGRAILKRADLSEANLREANLEEADLSRATLRSANLRGARLRRANLDGAQFDDADLERADLTGAHLPDGDALVALFGPARSLFRARFDPKVGAVLSERLPHLFRWMRDSEVV